MSILQTIWGRRGEGKYMTRLVLGRLRIHWFHRGDEDPDPHDHPWDFWTLPLRTYREEVWTRHLEQRYLGHGDYSEDEHWEIEEREVKAFRLHRRECGHIHRVIGPAPIITIVWTSAIKQKWGFYVDGRWVPWREYFT